MKVQDFIKTVHKDTVHVYLMDSLEDDFFRDCFTYRNDEWCTEGYEDILSKNVVKTYVNNSKAICLEVLQ